MERTRGELAALARQPGDRTAEDGYLVDQLVLDSGELLLTARLRRKAASEVLLARTAHREAQTLLTIPPIRTLHESLARRLRDMCTAALDAFTETKNVFISTEA